ncbi:cardiolipin synthase (CMP-forming)-like [Ruditapes philippinarum]|uniref:cardiolipin synthase (CMP-forming)-like n=1 Tax=Ruditapes philippinarum TaxID=129788 RepID=UPI00295B340C|nr:cardiolipin synthase (CMP-forming)-like [Ruditapes philippinarum]
MAAPMKMTFRSSFKIFRENGLMRGKFSILSSLDVCKKCKYSQSMGCHVQLYPKTCLYSNKHDQLSSCTDKGSNSYILKQILSVNKVSGVPTDNSNAIKSVLFVTDTSTKRHYSTGAESEGKNDDTKVTGSGKNRPLSKIGNDPKENIWTVPNLLTMSRILLTPVIGYLVVDQSFQVALGLFTFAGLTDLLDGYIARNFKNQMSAFGTALDPLADKILITVLTVTLTMAHLLPVPLAVLIIGRDVLLILAGFVIRYVSLPPPRTIKRYFDVTNPTAKLLPSTLSKVNTALQLSLVCFTLAAPVFDFVNHPLLQCLWGLTAATTFGSGVGYVITRKSSVKFLQQQSINSKK